MLEDKSTLGQAAGAGDEQFQVTSELGGWTFIPAAWLHDDRLRLADKGMLAYLLAQVNGQTPTIERIATESRDGVESVTSTLRRLEGLGYLSRTRQRNRHGQLGAYQWKLIDVQLNAVVAVLG